MMESLTHVYHKAHVIQEKIVGVVGNTSTCPRRAAWSCGGCGRRYTAELMRRAVTCARDRVDEVDQADSRSLEALLRSLGRSLAPDHALLLQLRQQLADLYRGAVASGERVPRRLLLRQAELCRGLLPLLTIVEPGISRLRGNI